MAHASDEVWHSQDGCSDEEQEDGLSERERRGEHERADAQRGEAMLPMEQHPSQRGDAHREPEGRAPSGVSERDQHHDLLRRRRVISSARSMSDSPEADEHPTRSEYEW